MALRFDVHICIRTYPFVGLLFSGSPTWSIASIWCAGLHGTPSCRRSYFGPAAYMRKYVAMRGFFWHDDLMAAHGTEMRLCINSAMRLRPPITPCAAETQSSTVPLVYSPFLPHLSPPSLYNASPLSSSFSWIHCCLCTPSFFRTPSRCPCGFFVYHKLSNGYGSWRLLCFHVFGCATSRFLEGRGLAVMYHISRRVVHLSV
ncbi:hypothetical protein BDN72DRAFT_530337 [Pluteus cervinus]|uniref:Uncharacterized protein n=1 Tax=Pluteus cervinus TaxID=181527 RepID=A0ACD3AZB3_9AGAR|nr:hypothetical protein BDN72DRAFT_530337 [Pluteus cervinus]